MRPRIMVENGRHPSLRIVAIRAGGLPRFRKLACMRVFMAIFANRRGTFELYLRVSHRHLVAISALYRAMRAEERKLCFRMVKAADVRPGSRIVARLAAHRRAVGAALNHPVVELAVVRIVVTSGATHVRETEGQDFVRSAGRTHLMAIDARNRCVRPGQRVTRLPMQRYRESRLVEVLDRVAVLTLVLIRRCSKLAIVGIFVTSCADREFDFIDCVFARWQMAFPTLNGNMLSPQRVTGRVVLLDTKERWFPSFNGMAFRAFAFFQS